MKSKGWWILAVACIALGDVAAVQADHHFALAAAATVAGIARAEVGVDVAIPQADAAPGRPRAEAIDQACFGPRLSSA